MAMSLADKEVRIVHVRDHYEGYINGQFVVSGDSWKEVLNELEELEA